MNDDYDCKDNVKVYCIPYNDFNHDANDDARDGSDDNYSNENPTGNGKKKKRGLL